MVKCTDARKQSFSLAMIAVLSVTSLSGCAGATRLPARSRGPSGENLQKRELDLAFLEEGGTRREEVVRRLSAIDTAYSNPRLFWGRWSESKWGYFWFVAAQGGGAGDAKRVWHVHNLLVSFDEDGVMQKKMLIDDEPALWRELHVQVANAAALNLPQDIPLAGNCCGPSYMTVTSDALQLTHRRRKTLTFNISPLKIVRISHSSAPDKRSAVGESCHTLYFSEKTPLGKSTHFCAGAPSVAAVFQYLAHFGAKDLRWE